MAKADDDWQKFMDSTKEEPEEVETDDELEDETPEDSEVEDDKADKSKKADSDKKPDTEEEIESDEEDEDDSDEPPEDKDKPAKVDPEASAYQPKLKQFFNDDGQLDPEKIEKGYIETSKEAVKLNDQIKDLQDQNTKILDAIAQKPEVAEALFGKEGAKQFVEAYKSGQSATPGSQGGKDKGPVDPVIRHMKAKLTRQQKVDYNEFVENNPEAVTDPDKVKKISRFIPKYAADYADDNDGEIPSMKETLEAAYRYYGWDIAKKQKEEVAAAAKKTAATRSTPQGKRPAPKKTNSDMEQFFAKKLNVKL